MPYIRSLDGLRAVAVFLVIISHAHWLHVGWVGVQLFFVLSGFLITGILLRDKERQKGVRAYLGRFYRRRTLRIFPLYFFALGIIALLDAMIGVRGFDANLPSLMTYTYNWGRSSITDSNLFDHFWSLSLEEQFYLVWPLLIWVLPRRRFTLCTVVLILLGPVLRFITGWLAPLYGIESPEAVGWFVYFASTSHLDAFAWGAGIAMMHKAGIVWPRRLRYWVAGIFALFIILGGVNLLYHYPNADLSALGYTRSFLATGTHIWGYTVINAFGATTILYLAHYGSRLLESKVLCYVGQISYGIYVYHYGIWYFVDKLFDPDPYTLYGLGCLLLAIGLTVLVSHVSYKWLEQPFLRLKEKKAMLTPALSASGEHNPVKL